MPLVKGGKINTDPLVHVADDAELPGEGAILISAARFLGMPRPFERAGTDRRDLAEQPRLDDLVPYLGRLAAVALVFPSFRDGRAYSQARLLRERHGYEGELRATGQVLRDQFVFMLRAGFDAFEVKKEADAEALPPRSSAIRCSTSRPATAAHGTSPAHATASFRERRPMNALADQVLPELKDARIAAGPGARSCVA